MVIVIIMPIAIRITTITAGPCLTSITAIIRIIIYQTKDPVAVIRLLTIPIREQAVPDQVLVAAAVAA
jgi:hypothetical protein